MHSILNQIIYQNAFSLHLQFIKIGIFYILRMGQICFFWSHNRISGRNFPAGYLVNHYYMHDPDCTCYPWDLAQPELLDLFPDESDHMGPQAVAHQVHLLKSCK